MTIPVWLFWLMIAVIVTLVALILVRDKGIRGGITGMGDWVRRKIRIAKIKSQIQKENQKKEELVKKLGKTGWENGVSAPFIETQMEEIRKLTEEEAGTAQKIKDLEAEIEKGRQEWEAEKKQADERIAGLDVELKPLEERHKELEKELHAMDKEIKGLEKSTLKAEKDIQKTRENLDTVEKDVDLSNIEKEQKREEAQRRIQSLEGEIRTAGESQNGLTEKIAAIKEQMAGLEPQINDLEARIGEAREVLKAQKGQWDESLKRLQENSRSLNVKLLGTRKELDLLHQKTGALLMENRIEHEALAPVYSEIDVVIASMEKLQGRLKDDQSDNSEA